MIYTTVSSKNLIARVIRGIGYQNMQSTYLDDLLEWIPSAMKQLQTKQNLELTHEDLCICDHIHKLPCGIRAIESVEYNGARLREGGEQRDIRVSTYPGNNNILPSIFQPSEVQNFQGVPYLTDNELIPITGTGNLNDFYKIQINYIQTSFEDGNIRLHYWKMPTDKEGYPLIPDNENYMEALYYFCRGKMIEAGYEDLIFNWQECSAKFELHGGRARAEIKYPSFDRMMKLKESFIRLIPPQHFYEDFSINNEQRERIR